MPDEKITETLLPEAKQMPLNNEGGMIYRYQLPSNGWWLTIKYPTEQSQPEFTLKHDSGTSYKLVPVE